MAGGDVHVGAVPGGLLRPEEGKQASSQFERNFSKCWGKRVMRQKIFREDFTLASIRLSSVHVFKWEIYFHFTTSKQCLYAQFNARLHSPQIKKVPPVQRHPPRHSLILLELPPWASGVAIGGDARQQISPHLDHGFQVLVSRKKRFFKVFSVQS